MSSNDFDKEIERILEYPREVSERVIKENKEGILTCLKYHNAFDDWGHILSFIHKIAEVASHGASPQPGEPIRERISPLR